jgi:hypothetical protein
MGFKATSPVFERAKMIHTLDLTATVIAESYMEEINLLLP